MKTRVKHTSILWAESVVDFPAIEEGRKQSKNCKAKNPYPKNTNKWYNWNKGFNNV